VAVIALFIEASIINAQQAALPQQRGNRAMPCPMMQDRDNAKVSTESNGSEAESIATMNMRGDKVMGFSQAKTTHHFRLMPDGGAIEVEVNDPTDVGRREQIRQHLAHIAQAFADGNFAAPMAVHDQIPPGASTMKRLRAVIKYKFDETERGARVRISTNNREALRAIYEFLRFQIKEHQTGDSLEVKG
jgi:hypothetical protein